MRVEPTRHSVLGTLVDRAACMPYAKPQVLRRGYRCDWEHDARRWSAVQNIRSDVGEAASFIAGCLKSRRAQRAWSKAQLAIDPAGPWWSKTCDQFFDLDRPSREWILERLECTAERGAERLQTAAEGERWKWLWSQPSFAMPGTSRPAITRPDLVAGLGKSRCLIIDLKATNKSDLSGVADDDLVGRFDDWTGHLERLGFVPTERWVLAVSTGSADSKWIQL